MLAMGGSGPTAYHAAREDRGVCGDKVRQGREEDSQGNESLRNMEPFMRGAPPARV